MKNSIKITAFLIIAVSTALIITTSYNGDDYEPTFGEKVGTAVRDTTDVVVNAAEDVIDAGANAAKDTASIVTTGQKRTPEQKKEDAKQRRQADKKRKDADKQRQKEASKKRKEQRKRDQ